MHDDHSVQVRFDVNVDTAMSKFRKHETDIFLFDEILSRTLKMHREHVYCSRFMVPYVWIDRINVVVKICSTNFAKVLGEIKFEMTQNGYPGDPKSLSDICPRLLGMTGSSLAQRVHSLNTGEHSAFSSAVDLLNDNREVTIGVIGNTSVPAVDSELSSRMQRVFGRIKSQFSRDKSNHPNKM